jgi:hypothetical protein
MDVDTFMDVDALTVLFRGFRRAFIGFLDDAIDLLGCWVVDSTITRCFFSFCDFSLMTCGFYDDFSLLVCGFCARLVFCFCMGFYN